ncbi:MAG: triose-phosphate isomerase [Oscillospiraceae bacterium]|nr:triose-phosphate isomerase [Oscillospiraceae bacterium]
MKRRLYIGTNTKMFQTGREAEEYIRRMDELIDDIRDRLEFFFIPSFTSLERVVRAVGERIRIGAQNMAWEDRGQFTGEVSPLMLEEIGVRFVLIGHSERRHVFGETDIMEAAKIRLAADHGFTALLCVGETAQQKESGLAAQSVLEQLKAAAGELSPEEASERLWIGYEPVWAIGTAGTPASASYAEDMHAVIRSGLVELFGEKGTEIPVLYGGSVNPSNAPEIIERNGIDGLFIGRSAWDPDRFNGIIRDVLPVFERRVDR